MQNGPLKRQYLSRTFMWDVTTACVTSIYKLWLLQALHGFDNVKSRLGVAFRAWVAKTFQRVVIKLEISTPRKSPFGQSVKHFGVICHWSLRLDTTKGYILKDFSEGHHDNQGILFESTCKIYEFQGDLIIYFPMCFYEVTTKRPLILELKRNG